MFEALMFVAGAIAGIVGIAIRQREAGQSIPDAIASALSGPRPTRPK